MEYLLQMLKSLAGLAAHNTRLMMHHSGAARCSALPGMRTHVNLRAHRH